MRDIFQTQTRAFVYARLLVRCYYVALLYFAVALLPDWEGFMSRTAPTPLWPVAWLWYTDLRTGIALILSLYLLGTLVGAILTEKRWARVLAFLGLFEFVAFNYSYGKIGHSLHAWVLTAFLLIFLPNAWEKAAWPARVVRQRFLTVFWACQALVMLIYSMAGLGKIAGAVYQFSVGQMHAFMPGALAAIVANRLIETNSRSLLGPWLIDHPLWGWPFMLADIYLQVFAFRIAFRPSLHKLWAVGLILFHIGSFLLLTISFAPSILLLALLFVCSPFHSPRENWRNMTLDLPLFGQLMERMVSRPCAS
jgi:hypothetical protein